MSELNQVNDEKGLTLVELLVSLLLVSLVGVASYQLMAFMQKNYERTQAYCRVTNEGSIATSRIASDIRSAVKPNNATKAVVIGTGSNSMDIYTAVTDSGGSTTYKQISYELVNDGGTQCLSRTVYESADAPEPSTTNPDYPTFSSDVIILRGVTAAAFADKDPDGEDDRREIGVKLTLHDWVNASPAIEDQEISQTYVTRSQELAY